ncbi:M23 family metallopeptidase [Zoogloea sp.]|uniref:M23 family metallopeptidase n=1 Tax=Zoogloea sp. TaxID=49181 RepID=UPI0035B3678B
MNRLADESTDSGRFDEFRESVEPSRELEDRHQILALEGIRASPFKDPYPVQKAGTTPAAGVAGELRGYYRRSDGSDRWKPAWSGFGHPRNGKTHQGLDIYARVGTPVVAIADGYAMLYPTPTPGDELGIKAGVTIRGSDNKKYDVLYGHLSSLEGVSRAVRKGDVIGYSGCTGNADDGACTKPNRCNGHSSHLHVAVRESAAGSAYLDPAWLFGWQLGYASDARDVACDQAFSSSAGSDVHIQTDDLIQWTFTEEGTAAAVFPGKRASASGVLIPAQVAIEVSLPNSTKVLLLGECSCRVGLSGSNLQIGLDLDLKMSIMPSPTPNITFSTSMSPWLTLIGKSGQTIASTPEPWLLTFRHDDLDKVQRHSLQANFVLQPEEISRVARLRFVRREVEIHL